MGMPMPSFNLPISWAACARWLSNSTSLRSRSSIFLRQPGMSIGAVGCQPLVLGPGSLAAGHLESDEISQADLGDAQRPTTSDRRLTVSQILPQTRLLC